MPWYNIAMSDVDEQLDLTVVQHSLSAVNEALAPFYDDVRRVMLGHAALGPITSLEQRRESIREDVRMIKAFGALLPPQQIRGKVVAAEGGEGFKAQSISSVAPDLYQAKVIQANALCYRSPWSHETTIAYVVGERPVGPRDVQLLMVTPPAHSVYAETVYDKIRYKSFDIEPTVLTVTVPAKALAAYRSHVHRAYAREFTDEQVRSMKKDGVPEYVLTQADLTSLRRWGSRSENVEAIEHRGLTPSPPRGWLERMLRLASLEPVLLQPREVTFDDFKDGLNGWSVGEWMMNLAIAFGKQDEYRRLIGTRIGCVADESQDYSI